MRVKPNKMILFATSCLLTLLGMVSEYWVSDAGEKKRVGTPSITNSSVADGLIAKNPDHSEQVASELLMCAKILAASPTQKKGEISKEDIKGVTKQFDKKKLTGFAKKEAFVSSAWLNLRAGDKATSFEKKLTTKMILDCMESLQDSIVVVFSSDPSGAEVFLFSRQLRIGVTPIEMFVQPGKHRVTFKKAPEYEDWSDDVDLQDGVTPQMISRKLKKSKS